MGRDGLSLRRKILFVFNQIYEIKQGIENLEDNIYIFDDSFIIYCKKKWNIFIILYTTKEVLSTSNTFNMRI